MGIFNTNTDVSGRPGSFFMNMELKQTGENITGNTRIDNQKDQLLIYKLTGSSRKYNQYYFSLLESNTPPDKSYIGPSQKFLELKEVTYSKNDTAEILNGKWMAGNEIGGGFWARKVDTLYDLQNEEWIANADKKLKIKLRFPKLLFTRKKINERVVTNKQPRVIAIAFEKRRNVIKDTLHIPASNITLELFDNGEIDGDSVTVYLNNKPVLKHQELKSEPIKFSLSVEKNKKYTITIYAENLGKIPPNTAVMIIKSKNYTNTIYLSSTLKSNVSVIIIADN